MKFYISDAHIVDIVVKTVHYIKQQDGESSEDFIIRKLKDGSIPMVTTSSEDHPVFAELRNKLENEGYIEIVRQVWNGDSVLKPFYLNGKRFEKDDRFFCAAAMRYYLKH